MSYLRSENTLINVENGGDILWHGTGISVLNWLKVAQYSYLIQTPMQTFLKKTGFSGITTRSDVDFKQKNE